MNTDKAWNDVSMRVTDAVDILKLIEDRDGLETEIVSLAVTAGAAGAARRILDEVTDALEDLRKAVRQPESEQAEAQL